MKRTRASALRNQKGIALVETVPLLVIFVALISFSFGFFGIIHTAILNSISARSYAFESFRQRANLYYFRENGTGLEKSTAMNYTNKGWRYHGINTEADNRSYFYATVRQIAMGRAIASSPSSIQTHNQEIYSLQPRNQAVSVNPVWVMVGYGLCLNLSCGE